MPSHPAGKKVTFLKWTTSLYNLPSILQVVAPALLIQQWFFSKYSGLRTPLLNNSPS